MNTILPSASYNIPGKAILKTLVDKSVKTSLPAAERNGSQILNDISDKLDIHVDENALGAIIDGLLYAVVNNAKDSQIRISAKEIYGNLIELFVKDDNCCHTYAVACNLQEIVPLAKKIGGDINIANRNKSITTVSFRFPAASEEMKSLAA